MFKNSKNIISSKCIQTVKPVYDNTGILDVLQVITCLGSKGQSTSNWRDICWNTDVP